MERLRYRILVTLAAVLVGYGAHGSQSAHANPSSGDINEAFDAGCDLYEASNFGSAAETFQSLVAKGVKNSAVYYNLGNAYYKQGQIGRAVASYRRALMLSPRDEDSKANLELLRSNVGMRDTTSSLGSGGLGSLPFRLISPREWQVVFYIAYYLSVVCFLCVLFIGGGLRGKAARILVVLVLVAAASFGLAAQGRARFSGGSEAVVVADWTEFMSGPGAAFEELTRLRDGVEMRLRARSGIWVEAELPTGEIGWVREVDLERI
jgi:tetratricopeptide (TPR) repeat protein